METVVEKLQTAASFIKSKITDIPNIGIVLGSGLGDFADSLEDKVEIPYSEIPGFHQTTVLGHAGKLVVGKIEGVNVAVMQGRIHAYEGHSMEEVVHPDRVLGMMGVKTLVLTNAAGGVNANYHPGQLILIKDHINFTGKNPLIGPNLDELGTRFPDMSFAWDPNLREIAKKAASDIGYDLQEGVYVGVLGPTYETPSEVRMFGMLGGDMVGMSTVAENIAAVHMGMKVMGISCVTNMAAGIEKGELKHEDIKDQAAQVMTKFCDILKSVVKSHG